MIAIYRIILLYIVHLPNRRGPHQSVSFFSISLKCQITKISTTQVVEKSKVCFKSKIKFSFDFNFLKVIYIQLQSLNKETIKGYSEYSTKICCTAGKENFESKNRLLLQELCDYLKKICYPQLVSLCSVPVTTGE